MTTATFEYHRPATKRGTLQLLSELDGEVSILAGGQTLLREVHRDRARPDHVVDISALRDECGTISATSTTLVVGLGVRQQELLNFGPSRHDALLEALRCMGNYNVRCSGTVTGIVANSDPACQLAAVCAAVGATVVIESVRGSRRIAASELFAGVRKLARDELVTEVAFDATTTGEGTAFQQVAQRSVGGPHLAGVATRILVEDGWCTEAAVAVAVRGQYPRALVDVAGLLTGTRLRNADLGAASEALAQELTVGDDLFASAEYKTHGLRVLVNRTAHIAGIRAEGNT